MRAFKLLAVALLALHCAPGAAQDYPNRAIRIIVPFAAGGSVDISTRLMATALSQDLGQGVRTAGRNTDRNDAIGR